MINATNKFKLKVILQLILNICGLESKRLAIP